MVSLVRQVDQLEIGRETRGLPSLTPMPMPSTQYPVPIPATLDKKAEIGSATRGLTQMPSSLSTQFSR